jgi:hypothetical protein
MPHLFDHGVPSWTYSTPLVRHSFTLESMMPNSPIPGMDQFVSINDMYYKVSFRTAFAFSPVANQPHRPGTASYWYSGMPSHAHILYFVVTRIPPSMFSLTNRYTLREVEMVRQQLMQVKPTAVRLILISLVALER